MDFCSVKAGIYKKALEIASKEEGYELVSEDIFTTNDNVGTSNKLNSLFGGAISRLVPEGVELDPVENVINAYIFEANKALLDKVPDYLNEVQGDVYKHMFEVDPKKTLFDIAVQANSDKHDAIGALNTVGHNLYDIAITLFPEARLGDSLEQFEFDTPPLGDFDNFTTYSLSYSGNFKLLQLAVLDYLQNGKHFLSNFNPGKPIDRYYFRDSKKGGRAYTKERFEHFLAIHNIDEDMFSIQKNGNGYEYVEVNQHYVVPKDRDSIYKSDSTNKQKAIIAFLSERFGLKNRIEIITKEDFHKRFPAQYRKNMNSAIHNGRIYLFPRASNQVVAEELLHPFIEGIFQNNKRLFNKVLGEAKKSFPKLSEEIKLLYIDQLETHPDNINKEIVTQSLARVFNDLFEKEESKSLRDVINNLTSWIKAVFYDLLDYFGIDARKVISPEDFGFETTLEDMARIINTNDTTIDVIFPEGTLYNRATESDFFSEALRKILKDKKIDKKMEEMMAELPTVIRDIRSSLNKNINKKQKDELTEVVRALEDVTNTPNLINIQLNTIVKVINVFDVIQKELELFDKDTTKNPDEKLAFIMSSYKTAQTLSPFSDMMLDLSIELENEVGKKPGGNPNDPLSRFYRLLSTAISTKDKIERRIQNSIKTPSLEILAKEAAPYYEGKINKIDSDIATLQEKITKESSVDKKANLSSQVSAKLKEKGQILALAPTRENLEKIFAGEFKDANKLSRMFEAGIANGHPLVQTFVSMIENVYTEAQQSTLNNRNELQRLVDKLVKETNISKRDTSKLYEEVLDTVDIPVAIEMDKEGNPIIEDGKLKLKYAKQNAILSEYDNTYLTKYLEFEFMISHYRKEMFSNYSDKEKVDSIKETLKGLYKEFREFKKENVNGQYKDEIYEMWGILDTVVDEKDGEPVTLKQITNDVYHRIEQYEMQMDNAVTTDDRDDAINALKEANVELKRLRSPYDRDGLLKTGKDKQIADLLIDFQDKKNKYGKREVSPEGEEKYRLDLQLLQQEFDKGNLTQIEFDKKKKIISKTQVSPEYLQILKRYSEHIDTIRNSIFELVDSSPVMSKLFDKTIRDKATSAYEVIKKITNPYRGIDVEGKYNEDGVIDGIHMEDTNPTSVAKVKEIQQAVEDLNYHALDLRDLSKEEIVKVKEFEKNHEYTNPEYLQLKEKQRLVKEFYDQHKDQIDYYIELSRERSAFSTSEPSVYYEQRLSQLLAELKLDPKIKEMSIIKVDSYVEGDEPLYLGGRPHYQRDGKWYEERTDSVDGSKSEHTLFDPTKRDDTGYEIVLARVIATYALMEQKNTQWWKDNHFITYKFEKGVPIPVEKPIYIWTVSKPTNPEHLLANIPANEYKRYVINDEYVNKDHKRIYKDVPAPKKGKYVNDRLGKLSKPHRDFLNGVQAIYDKSQEYLEDGDRMGHILPSIVKTKGENQVEFTKNFIGGDFVQMWKTNVGETDDDNALLLGGSQYNRRVVPKRFVGVMDNSRQSKNIPAMIALFDFYASINNKMNEKLPLFEAIELTAKTVGTVRDKSVIDKLSFLGKIKHAFSNKAQIVPGIEKNPDDVSTLSGTVTGLLNMLVYGQTSKPAIINIGPFGRVDMQKVIKGFSGFVGKTIFVGNLISAINNSVSTRLNALIQSGIKGGLFTPRDLIDGQAKAVKYSIDLLSDWTKMGDKSLIGQIIDYFQVLPEGINEEITKKSEFTLIKRKGEFLTTPKSFSEFEVLFAQIFLPMANATMVKKNGKLIKLSNFEEVYELKNGNLQLQEGVEFSKQEQLLFTKSFRKMARDIGGAYRSSEQTLVETEWWGHAVMFMRKYFVPLLTSRYAGMRYSIEQQKLIEGFYTATLRNFTELFTKYHGNAIEQWHNLTDEEKLAFRKTMTELAVIGVVNLALVMFGGWDDKKKLKDNSYAYNMALVTLFRAKSEVETFNFIAGWNEMIRTTSSPFVAMQTMKNIYRTLASGLDTIDGSEGAFYKQNSGMHKKGDSKLIVNFLKTIGYSGYTFHPEDYIINFRNMQSTIR